MDSHGLVEGEKRKRKPQWEVYQGKKKKTDPPVAVVSGMNLPLAVMSQHHEVF